MAASVTARGNIEWGLSDEGNLAYHEIHEASAFPLIKKEELALARVSQGEEIEAVRVYDLKGDSTSVIQKGGLGENYVVVALESARGEGYRSRKYLEEGNSTETNLIYYDIHDKIGIPLMKRDEDIEVGTLGDETIRAVIIHDISIKGSGEMSIDRSGLYRDRLKIHLTAPVGDGYKFLVKVIDGITPKMALKFLLGTILLVYLSAPVVGNGDLTVGNPHGKRLLHHEIYRRKAVPFIKRVEEVEFTAPANATIQAVVVKDLKGNGESYIQRGAVGMKGVT
ncbi:unnamed protein product, partial [Iphiclides podalirius]